MKHTHPLQKRRKIKRHKMVWRHQGEGPGSDWVEAQTSAWRLRLRPLYVLQVCFMLVQVRWCLFLHFHLPLLSLFRPSILMSFSYFPFTVAVSDPFCSSQVCKPGSVLIPQIPQTILILICGFLPWLLKPMSFLYLMENLLNLMFMFLGRGQKLEETPMGFTGWTCKVRIETWSGI